MRLDDRFLATGVRLDIITPAIQAAVLQHQETARLQKQPPRRAGDLLVDLQFVTEAQREQIVAEQSSRKTQVRRLPRWVEQSRTHRKLQFGVVLIALAIALSLRFLLAMPFEGATAIASFVAYVIAGTLQYLAYGSPLRASWRAALTAVPLAIFLFLSWAILRLYEVKSLLRIASTQIGVTDANPQWEVLVKKIVNSVHLAIWAAIALFALSVLLALSALFHNRSQRFASARMTALKDLLIGINQLRSGPSSIDVKIQECLSSTVDKSRAILAISVSDSIRRMFRLRRPHSIATSITFLVPDQVADVIVMNPQAEQVKSGPSPLRTFHVHASAYPPDTPSDALVVLKRIEKEYHPAMFNEERYTEAINHAKGYDPDGWEERYHNIKDRHQYCSAVGYSYAKRQILMENDVTRCLLFDSEFVARLRLDGEASTVQDWIRVGSYIACPVRDDRGGCHGVLFAFKNIPRGFSSEDIESLSVAAELIRSIYRLRESGGLDDRE